MESLEKICRLCLKNCYDNSEVINELMKEVINTHLLESNPAISEKPVVCTNCAEIMQKCFDFKSTCFSTQDCIARFLNKNNEKLDLKDICLSKGENKNVVEIPDDYNVCAFCMRLSKSSFISLNNEDVKMVKKCLPELDFRFIKSPSICTTCYGSLQNYFCFIMDCSIVEEKIMKYCEDACIKGEGQLKLSSMLQFITTNLLKMEGEHNTVDTIKVEEFCVETEKGNDEVDHKNGNFAETGGEECKNVVPLISESTLACEEDDSKVNIIKVEEICKEEEIEIHHENQSFLEMKDEKFLTNVKDSEIKTEQYDTVRIRDIRGRPKCYKLFQCECCSYQTRYKRHFEAHTLVHKSSSEVTMYQCEYCLFQTKYEHNLKKHLKGIHGNPTKEKIYHCNTCSYKTSRKHSLKRHLMIHKKLSEITMYQCESCSYQTKYNYELKKHLVVHKKPSDITMYQCESCSFQTKYKDSLKKHLNRIHKNLLEVNVYQCATCSYQTNQKDNLVNHLRQNHRNHTEVKIYRCKSCLYITSRKHLFKVHLLIHKKPSDIKIYQCESCSYQTKHNCNLNRHLMIHKKPSEIKMYQCKYCSFQTMYKTSVKNHLERQHGIPPEEDISFESGKFAEKCEDHQRDMPTHKEPSKLQCLIKTNFKKIFETV